MSKFAIGFAPSDSLRNETGRRAVARVGANAPRRLPHLGGYLAIIGFLTALGVGSLSLAVWRLFHFVH